MAEQPASEKTIFQTAMEKTSLAERESYLDEACDGNEKLRREIAALLAAHDRLPPPALDVSQPQSEIDLDPPILLTPPGTVIGRYKLLEPIGEGGYGTVFMAEQTSPVQRKVALKIIKAGMDTKQVIARFEAERQALALMDHPNIARVFDAGVTDTGRPYFVMELVKGVAITKYCDEHRLTPKQRLELFNQVCHAVQHAHQKGIIHRDIKPSNVLIAQYDGVPMPKVIDFGVAKAAGQQLTERTMFTSFGDVIGTLEYMSPEQAEMNQLDIDTRSDVYSLGVLLYELLTGTTPLEHKRAREAALMEVLRLIREEEPPRPSTRLTTTAELASIAAQRGVEPRKLSTLVRGELDWIVMKALEKDRTRRYETANGFASDIERYLTDEQVLACPPSAAYRFRKFARRNRGALLAASAMVAMLLVLVAGLTISNVRVARERNQKSAALKEKEQALIAAKASAERAQAERQRAESNFVKARTAVTRILAKAATGQAEWKQLSPALRKVFVDETALYYQSLIQEGGADPSVRYETAVGYRSLGFLHSSAKEFDKAEKYYRQSIEMLEALLNESGTDVEYRHQLANSNGLLGATLRATTRPAEAQAVYERGAALYEGLVAQAPDDLQYPPELWKCYNALLKIYVAGQADRDLRRTRERAERVCREWARLAPNDATVHRNLGFIFQEQGKLDEAVAAYRKAVELNPNDAVAHRDLGWMLLQQGKSEESAVVYRRAIELDGKNAGAHQNLAAVLLRRGKFDEAAAAARKGVELDPNADGAWVNLGEALRGQKKFDEAAAAYREAIELDPKDGSAYGNVGRPRSVSPQVAAYENLGRLLYEQKKLEEAAGIWRELIQRDPKLLSGYFGLGIALLEQGKHQDALDAFNKALAIDPQDAEGHNSVAWLLATFPGQPSGDPDFALALAKKAVELDPKNGAYLNTLGVACYRMGDWKETVASLEKSTELRKGGDSSDWFFLAMARWQLGEKDKARESYDQAVKWMEKNAPKHPELIRFRNEAAALLGMNEPK